MCYLMFELEPIISLYGAISQYIVIIGHSMACPIMCHVFDQIISYHVI